MSRSEYKVQRIKNNKLDKLKEENEKLEIQLHPEQKELRNW